MSSLGDSVPNHPSVDVEAFFSKRSFKKTKKRPYFSEREHQKKIPFSQKRRPKLTFSDGEVFFLILLLSMHGFTILCGSHSPEIKVIKVTKEVDIPHNTLPKQKKTEKAVQKNILCEILKKEDLVKKKTKKDQNSQNVF